MDAIVRRKLQEGRRRLIVRDVLESGVWVLFACLAGLLVVRIMGEVFPGTFSVSWISGVVLIFPILVVLLLAAWRWRSSREIARELDARAGTKDRFLTVLDVEGALSAAVRQETHSYFSSWQMPGLRARHPGKVMFVLLLPLAGLAMFEGYRFWEEHRPRPGLPEAAAMIAEARRLAEERVPADEEFEKVVEELAEAEARIKASPDPLREALRALADLERRLAAGSAKDPKLDAESAKALAESVQAQNPGLAEALRSGDNAAAAREVAAMDPADLAKALEQAARHRENQQLRELAEQSAGQAQAQLRRMLDPSGSEGREGGRGRFLSALRDLKNGTSSSEQSKGQGDQPGESPQGGEKPAAANADNAPPGGAPGSERDLGRGADLAGEADPKARTEGLDEHVSGAQGDGASLVKMLRASGGDDPEALRDYRSAYEAAAPAAIDAVNQENVPAGSRILVRKYFEAIRPKD